MPRFRRTPPRILAPLLAALFISSLPAPFASDARAAAQNSPPPAQKSQLDAPARELARRIAANFQSGTRVELEVHNQSSLSEDDVSVLRAAMAEELNARGLRTSGEGPGAASVTVTFSENVQGYVWIAQVQHGDDSAVLLQSVPRETAAAAASESEKIVLHKELLWSGPERVLDAVEMPGLYRTPARLFLLELDGTTAVVTEPATASRKELTIPVFNLRDPFGHIWLNFRDNAPTPTISACVVSRERSNGPASVEQITTETETSTVFLAPQVLSECSPIYESAAAVGPEGPLIATPPPCESGLALLHSGEGDYTQPDVVVAYAQEKQGEPESAPISFPGPVIRFEGDPNYDSPMAIVLNLRNGNYEVYRITAACGQ